MSEVENLAPERILFASDDAGTVESFARYAGKRFAISSAREGAAALEIIEREAAFPVLVTDDVLPDMEGIELCIEAERMAPDMVRIMMAEDFEGSLSQHTLHGDVFQTLSKPCPPAILASALVAGIKQHRLILAERELLERTLNGSIRVLAEVMASLDPKSFGEAQQMKEHMRRIIDRIKPRAPWEFEIAATLCRIGYVTVPGSILQKARSGLSLTPVERSMLARTPEFGQNLLASIPRLESVARMIYYQSKNFDGTGFPDDAVSGDQIPKGARILRILSDVMRHEADGLSRDAAFEVMAQTKGVYDPKLLQLAQACLLHDRPKDGRPVALAELAIGQVLAAPVETSDGMLIVAAGSRISHVLLEKLQHFTQLSGIREPIYVQNE